MLPLVKDSHSKFNLILASGSARRIELFNRLGFKFQQITSNFPEDLDKASYPTPIDYVRATCQGKVNAVNGDGLVVACDTVVVRSDGVILEKPSSRLEAREMILSLLGDTFKVCSVVTIKHGPQQRSFEEVSEVEMRSKQEISEEDIEGYLDTCNYQDLAGGLALHESGMVFVKGIKGCFFNVVGFPMSRFYQELQALL